MSTPTTPAARGAGSFFAAWALKPQSVADDGVSSRHSGSTSVSPLSPRTQISPARDTLRRRVASPVALSEGDSDSKIRLPPTTGIYKLADAAESHSGPKSTVGPAAQPASQSISPSSSRPGSGTSSKRSSIGSKALKLIRIPDLRIALNATKDRQPPRTARGGHHWSMAVSGQHWVEKRDRVTSRATKSSDSSGGASHRDATAHELKATPESKPKLKIALPSPRPMRPPLVRDGSPKERSDSGPVINFETEFTKPKKLPTLSPNNSPSPQKKLGFLQRPVQYLKNLSRHSPPLEMPTPATIQHNSVKANLDKVSMLLRNLTLTSRRTTPADSPYADSPRYSPHGSRGSTRVSGPVWMHKSTLSYTSSIRELRMGVVPVPTPSRDATYRTHSSEDKDSEEHILIDISEPGGTTFLPSEARRVNTPPLPQDSIIGKNRRGFFFDYNNPAEGTTPGSPRRNQLVVTPGGSEGLNWFEAAMLNLNAEDEQEPVKIIEEEEDQFDFNVPEHLPTSPICPRHPKHASGGTGVCVYHGRSNRQRSRTALVDSEAQRSHRRSRQGTSFSMAERLSLPREDGGRESEEG